MKLSQESPQNFNQGQLLFKLNNYTLPQKELLYAIADEGRAQRITSGQFIKRHYLQSASSVQAAIRKLIEYGLVTSSEGSYYIEDQLFHYWLQKS